MYLEDSSKVIFRRSFTNVLDTGIKHWYFKQNEDLQNLRGVSSDIIMATGPANSQHPVPLNASMS